MSSSVLNWTTPYHQLFLNNMLFLIDPKVFGCRCFVRDVRPQVSKLDLKSLKCIFVGYSRVHKGYKCYCLTLRRYFVSTDVAFFETTSFSLSSTATSQGEDDDVLVYTVVTSALLLSSLLHLPFLLNFHYSSILSVPKPFSLKSNTSYFIIKSNSE